MVAYMAVEKIIIGRNREDAKSFGSKGAAYIGKHVVGKGEEAHLTNPIYMDVVRPHVVLVAGKRGSGKCVEENTLVTLDNGSVVPIKDLEKGINDVQGLDKKLKVAPLRANKFFKRKVSKLLKIRTRGGKEIQLTPEHPLLTIKGWEEIRDLGIGSRIATPRRVNNTGCKVWDESKIKLLAYLIAEGHIKGNMARFSNNDNTIINDFIKSLEVFDPNLKLVEYKNYSYGISQRKKRMDLSLVKRDNKGNFIKGSKTKPLKNSMVTWLQDLKIYNRLSTDKIIPNELFLLTKNQISLFLNRLFSCDGSVYKHKTFHGMVWEISYSSSSEKLIRQVQHLLLRFGIISRLRYKTVKCNNKDFHVFELVIGTDNIIRFINEIGFFGKKKLKEKSCLTDLEKIIRNTNIDTIPKEIWDTYRPKNWAEIGRKMNYSIAKGLRSSINYSPSRQKLLQIAEFDENEVIKTIAESDIFWDEIVMIEELDGDFNVCDISVPETHNFIANDIIVHNSYCGGVVAEEITTLPGDIKNNLSVLMVDTMGIFWSMKKPNIKDADVLKEWKLKPKGMNVRLFVPKGFVDEYKNAGVDVDGTFSLACGELTPQDWMNTFGFSMTDENGIAIERIISKVQKWYGKKYSIDDIIRLIEVDKKIETKTKNSLFNYFSAAKRWGIFEDEGTSIKSIFERGKVTVIDVSHYARTSTGWSVRGMLIGILARKVFQQRLMARKTEEFDIMAGQSKDTVPMVWMIIDEAHQVLPAQGQSPALEPMLTLIKEGREPGISLLLITQRPNKLHEDALAQSDLVISHRLTAKSDIEALRSVMQTYMLEDIKEYINTLPRKVGAAIVLDDNMERIYSMQVRPRMSWHAGGSPMAMKKKGLFE
jgi:intein/homing endonuclease